MKCSTGFGAFVFNRKEGFVMAIENKTLMETLIDAGYPCEEMYHHCSDLYIFFGHQQQYGLLIDGTRNAASTGHYLLNSSKTRLRVG